MLVQDVTVFRLSMLLIVIALFMACGGPQEIPATTSSEEARKHFTQGLALLDNVRFDEARSLFDSALEADPEFAMAHYYRAITASSAEAYQTYIDKAVKHAAKATEGEQLLILALQANADNQSTKAIGILQQLTQKFPNDKRVHDILGFNYLAQDEDDKAIAAFEKSIAIDSNYTTAYNNLGYAYMKKQEFEKAEKAFQTYLKLLPGEANPHDSMADLYTRMGRHEDAISHYEQSLSLNPNFAMSRRKIGNNLLFMGKYDEAREAYRKAMTIETTAAAKIIDLDHVARSYLYEGNFNEALARFDESIARATEANLPERIAASHSQKCLISLAAGNLAEAESSLIACKKAVVVSDLRPSFKNNFAKDALFQEALIAAKHKDFNKAMALASELLTKIEADDDPSQIKMHHDLLGYIYFEQGEYEEAVAELKQGDLEDPYNMFRLAQAESHLGNIASAKELYKKVAGWNQNSLSYGLVRADAIASAGAELAGKD